MDNKISIIVPVYKVEAYLDRCIESIVNQDYMNLEIILVDDGSPDRCPEMCDMWAQRDSRIRVIHKENGGLASARNRGLDAATGSYLFFVDSDDYIAPNLCSRIMSLFAEEEVEIVIFNSCRVDINGISRGSTEKITDAVLMQEEALEALLAGKINSYAWNKMYKRQVFQDVRFPEGRLWEDVAIAPRLLLNAKKIRCLPEALYFYCEREGSIVANINEKVLGDIFLARKDCYELLKTYDQHICRVAFDWVTLAAINLFDRSLYANVNQQILSQALCFLRENRDMVQERKNFRFWMYYHTPQLYVFLRRGRHGVKNIIKNVFQR